jgi:signal peptidase
MNAALRATRLTITVVGGVVLCACVGLLFLLGIGPQFGWYRTATVLSGSMTPGLPIGSVVVESKIDNTQIAVGDVITYRYPTGDHHLITHRVVRILQPGELPTLQTKGDANNTPDPVAKLQQPYVWQVRHDVPRLGYLLLWLRNPRVHFLGSILIPFLLAGYWIVRIWRPERNSDTVNTDNGEDRDEYTDRESDAAETWTPGQVRA